MNRLRVEGKREHRRNIDYIDMLMGYGLKRSTIMSYWKDAVKQNPDSSIKDTYKKVCKMIDEDLGD